MVTKLSIRAFLGLVFTLNIAFAEPTNAQVKSIKEVEISLELDNLKLIDVFNEIENITDYHFSYSSNKINLNSPVSLHFKNASVEKILLEISNQKGLKFRQTNNSIGVYISETEKSEEKVSINITDLIVNGKITDEKGLPLIGVTVVEKGTVNGTVSDVNGNYSLQVANDATLVFSFIGFISQEIKVDARSELNVQMIEDVESLSEVVVIGYGEVKREDLTGSIGTVSQKEIKQLAVISLDQGIQGRVPGVQVTQSSAEPGGGVSVRIRGINSINGTNEPLYVIDGIPIINNDGAVAASNGGRGNVASNALSSINPNDIQSMEILKDASATAIYGARGANGVVIITTTKGKAGKTNVNFDSYYGVQSVANTYDLADAQTYAKWANEFALNQGESPYFSEQQIDSLGSAGTDWQDEIYRTAPIQNHQISVSGGNNKTTFYMSTNYFKQDGVVKESSFERVTLRLNLDHYVNDKLKIGNSLMLSGLQNRRVPTNGNSDGATAAAQSALPIMPVYNQDGSYMLIQDFQQLVPDNLMIADVQPNPVSKIRETTDIERTNTVLANIYAQYELLEGLKFKVSVGANISDRGRDTYFSQLSDEGRNAGGRAIVGNSERRIFLNENTLSYNRLFGKHEIQGVAGFTAQYENLSNNFIANSGFGIDDADLNINDIGSGTQVGGPTVNSFKSEESLASFLARIVYSYDDRYLFTFTSRADGSSKFSKGNKWGFFPSAAIGWKISNEDFMSGMTKINNLKIRGSYGQSGFQEINPYQSLAQYRSQNYSFDNTQVVGYEPLIPASSDLSWQTTEQLDIGLDVGLFSNRLTFSADYYIKNTSDLLLFINLPANTGYSSPLALNIGEVRNTGWEFSLGTNLDIGELMWSSNLNFSGNKNEVLSLGSQQRIFGGQISSDRKDDGNLTQVGEPVGVFFGYRTDGIFANDSEVEAHTSIVDGVAVQIQPNAKAGERRFVDVNGDGRIDGDDRVEIGDPYPEFIFGWSNNLYYKNFDLSFFFQGTYGNEILNVASEVLRENDPETNILVERYTDRWTPDNLGAKYPKAGAQNPISGGSGGFGDYTVEDGSYLRLRDVTLGFTPKLDNVKWISRVRIYASIQNAFTITNYSGVNPENSSFGQNATNFGIDVGGYPMARIYRLGVNFNL
ncbi:TonB-dependent receptor [Marinigracilibium pacificum]|uniref:TonB-dependent receptor n=1 Tax=Marinigracilibium pacificum TaxID=2729599 RepID=A0A848J322_9BACT|nr:TonB-dependent receptor [Marinigracilibium pacificum]NMM48739.1 TonB-dependent receptor [Marinigracilibium pacificum]